MLKCVFLDEQVTLIMYRSGGGKAQGERDAKEGGQRKRTMGATYADLRREIKPTGREIRKEAGLWL